MITAVDTNVLLDVLLPNPRFAELSANALAGSRRAGIVVVCEVVYAELCGAFDVQDDCDAFLEASDIQVEPLGRRACFAASRLWAAYLERGSKRERILPDFLIGAHAQTQASRLLTRDRGFYHQMFPDLVVVEPAGEW